MQSKKRYGFLAVGMLAFLLAGVIYAWSTIKAPFSEEFGWEGTKLNFNFTLTMIFFCLGGLFSGLISKKVSSRLRMILSAVLLAGGFFITSRLTENQIALLYIGYGFMAGTGIGIVYNTLIALINPWFQDRKGLCSGCLMMAFGFSALLVGLLAKAGFASESVGWRTTYLLLGLAGGIVLLAAGLILRAPRPDELNFQKGKAKASGTDYTPAQMLRRPSFYKLFVFFFLLASVGSTAIGLASETLKTVNLAEQVATVVGFISICNGLGRLISGAAFDALGLRRTQFLTSAVAVISPALVLISLLTGASALAIIGLCLCGISYGFSPTVTVAFVGAFYGQKNFAVNLPILNLVLIPASFMSTIGSMFATPTPVYAILIGFSLLGLLINISIREA